MRNNFLRERLLILFPLNYILLITLRLYLLLSLVYILLTIKYERPLGGQYFIGKRTTYRIFNFFSVCKRWLGHDGLMESIKYDFQSNARNFNFFLDRDDPGVRHKQVVHFFGSELHFRKKIDKFFINRCSTHKCRKVRIAPFYFFILKEYRIIMCREKSFYMMHKSLKLHKIRLFSDMYPIKLLKDDFQPATIVCSPYILFYYSFSTYRGVESQCERRKNTSYRYDKWLSASLDDEQNVPSHSRRSVDPGWAVRRQSHVFADLS